MSGNGQQSDKDNIISILIQFDEFSKFYNTEFVPRNIAIDLKINSLCKMFALYSHDENNNPFIEIQKLPETLDDAFLVAHELCHAIRDFDGCCHYFWGNASIEL